jgi:hypothetical protein
MIALLRGCGMDNLVNLIEEMSSFDDLDSVEFNGTLAEIQEHIGQDDGGFASVWFSGREDEWVQGDKVDRKEMLAEYIKAELIHLGDPL